MRVTIDIFSGRPNPSWTVGGSLAGSVLREIGLHRSAFSDPSHHTGRLGYRRLLIELADDQRTAFNLPHVFSIADGMSDHQAKELEIAEKLVDLAPLDDPAVGALSGLDAAAVADARKFFAQQIARSGRPPLAPRSHADEFPPESMLPNLSAYETAPFAPEVWDDPLHVGRNNCYAYAANRRTDTYPQPGRASGHQVTFFSFEDVVEAVESDGAIDAADPVDRSEAPRHLVALFVWPGRDYHCYRLHSDGSWGHKPGPLPARTVDDAGTWILDPRTCSRAEYSDFCGFFFIPRSFKVQ